MLVKYHSCYDYMCGSSAFPKKWSVNLMLSVYGSESTCVLILNILKQIDKQIVRSVPEISHFICSAVHQK